MTDIPTVDMIEETLDLVAEWLIAAYGSRIAAVSLEIEGHYGPTFDCYGIVPITLDRGCDPDGHPETRQTLPTLEVCGRAEVLFQRLCPAIRFDHDNARDVRRVGSSRLFRASDVSAHRRIELRRLHGVLVPDAPGR
jgi:hypothetical protein